MTTNTPNTTRRPIGVFALTMITIIAIDSLRTLPFSAAYGTALISYYLIAAIIFFLPVSYAVAELATGWPTTGGIYVWVREAFGELPGFMTIWLQWVYNIVWYPTILAFIAGTLATLIQPDLANNKYFMFLVILTVFWGATLLNCLSLRVSSVLSTLGALIGTLVPMLVISILGLVWIVQGKPSEISFNLTQLIPHFRDVNDLSFLLAVIFGLVGVEVAATHAEDVVEPARTFPRAIAYATVIILASLIFSSLAIAIVVPTHQLNIITGLTQAFHEFCHRYHCMSLYTIICCLMILGGIGGVSTWIISPTKGLLVATRDGSAPAIFGKTNRHGSPVVILLLQAVICSLLSAVFLFMPSVNSSYWLLTAMTAQLAMLVYVAMFAALIKLRYTHPHIKRAYRIPGGQWGVWCVGGLGLGSCLFAIALGFVPPSQVEMGNLWVYEGILLFGIIGLCLPPIIIYHSKRRLLIEVPALGSGLHN